MYGLYAALRHSAVLSEAFLYEMFRVLVFFVVRIRVHAPLARLADAIRVTMLYRHGIANLT